MTPEFTMQDFEDSKRDAEQTIRRAIKSADGLDNERMAARLAFDWEDEAIQKRNEDK